MSGFRRFLGCAARAGFYAGGLLLCAFWLWSSLIWIPMRGSWLFWAATAVVLGIMAALFRRNVLKRGRNLGIAYACLAAVYIWMGWDAAKFDLPLTLADLGPATAPQAEESYGIVLGHPPNGGNPYKFSHLRTEIYSFLDLKDMKSLARQSASLRAYWVKMEPERRWFADLDGFGVIGDLSAARTEDRPFAEFRPFRELAVIGSAHACLLATEGKGDEAVDVLLPIIRVSLKLEPASRSFMRSFMARDALHQALTAATYVVAHAAVSPDRRDQLAVALAGGDASALLHRALMIEYARLYEQVNSSPRMTLGNVWLLRYWWSDLGVARHAEPLYGPTIDSLTTPGVIAIDSPQIRDSLKLRMVVSLADRLDRLLVLRHETLNEYAFHVEALASAAAKRDLDGYKRSDDALNARLLAPPLRNLGGTLLLSTIPDYTSFVREFWETEDMRLALAAKPKG
jgi:hypothetical protein